MRLGGDREVYFEGHLTLDPRRYLDPVFSLVLPLLIMAIGGIPLPGGAVWINHHSLRSPATLPARCCYSRCCRSSRSC